MDPEVLYDAPLREKIYAMVETFQRTNTASPTTADVVTEGDDREGLLAEGGEEGGVTNGKGVGSTLLNGDYDEKEKQVQLEIDKFRKKQAIRDK